MKLQIAGAHPVDEFQDRIRPVSVESESSVCRRTTSSSSADEDQGIRLRGRDYRNVLHSARISRPQSSCWRRTTARPNSARRGARRDQQNTHAAQGAVPERAGGPLVRSIRGVQRGRRRPIHRPEGGRPAPEGYDYKHVAVMYPPRPVRARWKRRHRQGACRTSCRGVASYSGREVRDLLAYMRLAPTQTTGSASTGSSTCRGVDRQTSVGAFSGGGREPDGSNAAACAHWRAASRRRWRACGQRMAALGQLLAALA